MFGMSRNVFHSPRLAAVLAVLGLLAAGCSGGPSAEDRAQKSLAETKGSNQTFAKFAGKVLIDGKPPGLKLFSDPARIFVMLYDVDHPPSSGHPVLAVGCAPEPNDGQFEFSTLQKGDGVPVGKYIVLFGKWGGRFKADRGPDQLHNLYNDPDKNKNDSRFNIEVTKPGKDDYVFDLAVEGKPTENSPGPNAIVHQPGS
jgi:hypothetical protein